MFVNLIAYYYLHFKVKCLCVSIHEGINGFVLLLVFSGLL